MQQSLGITTLRATYKNSSGKVEEKQSGGRLATPVKTPWVVRVHTKYTNVCTAAQSASPVSGPLKMLHERWRKNALVIG